jgi:fatty acyl-CoA reductase
MKNPDIAEFYQDKSIFITGATGFMGKVLVEKLLRSCPGIDRVYLLLRPSKGKDVTTRLEELINNEVMNLLRFRCPFRIAYIE